MQDIYIITDCGITSESKIYGVYTDISTAKYSLKEVKIYNPQARILLFYTNVDGENGTEIVY